MAIFSVAGTKVYIGPPLAAQTSDFVLGQFTSLSYVQVHWLENIGQFGDESAEIDFAVIELARMQKLKGVRNAGNLALVMGVDYTDEGQTLIVNGEATAFDYAWKVLFNDMPSGGTSGSVRYFIGKIQSKREQFDTVNNIIRLNASIMVNSNIVRVNAF